VKLLSTYSLVLLGFGSLLTCCQHAAAPDTKSAIRIRWARDPESLDPFVQPNSAAIEALNLLNQSLLNVDYSTRSHAPQLAQSMPISQSRGDSLTEISFQIRPEASWDSGHPVLATDVAFTFRLLYCPRVPAEAVRFSVDFLRDLELTPQDPRRITMVCRGHSLNMDIALGEIAILPEANLDPKGELRAFSLQELQHPGPAAQATMERIGKRYEAAELGRHPEHMPGSGPYRLAGWNVGREVVFTRKAGWWGDKVSSHPSVLAAATLPLRYVVFPEDASATLALRRGELDLYPNMPARTFIQLKNSTEAQQQLRFYEQPSLDVLIAGFNTSRPALADTATRHALSYLFNAVELLQGTQVGQGKRTVGIFTPYNTQIYNDSLFLLPFSPSTAVTRLQRAGWHKTTAGWLRGVSQEPLHLTLRYRAGDPTFEVVALQFSQAARQIGLDVTLRPSEATLLSQTLRTGDFDMFVQVLRGNPFSYDLSGILTKEGIGENNLTRFATPASDQLIHALAAAETPAQQRLLIRKVQKMMQEQMPLVPLFFTSTRIVASHQLAPVNTSVVKPGYVASALTRTVTPSSVTALKNSHP